MGISRNGLHRLPHIHLQVSHHLPDNQQQGREHTSGLERIGPHQCLNASSSGIEPYQGRHHQNGNDERGETGPQWGYHKAVQQDAHHIETHGRSCHLRQQEEARTRLVRLVSQSSLQIRVDGGHIPAVIHGQQDKRHRRIA